MKRRCFNCMKVFPLPQGYEDDDNVCPFCGFVENTPPKNPDYLPVGTELNNRYSIK